MRNKFVPSMLMGLVFLLVFSVSTAFGASNIGDPSYNPDYGWKRYTQYSSEIMYSGNWWNSGNAKQTGSRSASVKFNFVGSSVRLIAQNYGYGSYDISDNITVIVDKKPYTTISMRNIPSDYYNPRLAYELTGLSNSEHSIEFINQTDKLMFVSAVDVPSDGQLRPYNPDAVYTPKVSVTAVTYTVYLNQTFDVQIKLDNVKNIYAEDVSLTYDKTRFELVDAYADNKLMIIHQKDSDVLRFITASKGRYNGINGSSALLNLKFRATNLGRGKVDVVKAIVADNGQNEVNVARENMNSWTFTVVGSPEFSLKHIGKLAYHYQEDKSVLPSNIQNVVGDNGPIEQVDLKQLVKSVLSNPLYN